VPFSIDEFSSFIEIFTELPLFIEEVSSINGELGLSGPGFS